MVVYCVNVFVKPGHIDAFREATRLNHEGTRKEPGNLRFDVLESADEPGRFLLYEVYTSEEAVAAHKETAHYHTWRETVAGWMAKPREGSKFTVICPEEPEAW